MRRFGALCIFTVLLLGFSTAINAQESYAYSMGNSSIDLAIHNKTYASNFHYNSLSQSYWQTQKQKSELATFLIWTGGGLASGFLTGFVFGLLQESGDGNSKKDYALIYGTFFGLVGGGGGAIIGLGKAFSIWDKKPKEKPVIWF